MSSGVVCAPISSSKAGACCPSDSLDNASRRREGETSPRPPACTRAEIDPEVAPVIFASELWIKVTRVLDEYVYASNVTVSITQRHNEV